MNTKIIAIIAVAIVAVGGIATAAMVLDNDDGGSKNKGGWYSWDPTTILISSSNASPSPHWGSVIEMMYEELYGELPDYDKYTIDDVPNDFLSYDSLVKFDSSGNLVVTSKYYTAGTGWSSKDVVFTETPTGMVASGSYLVSLYYVLCAEHGVDPMSYDKDVVSELWTYALAGDRSLLNVDLNYGIPADGFKGIELPIPFYIMDNKEIFVDTITKLVEEDGEVPLWVCSGSMPAYDNGGKFIEDIIKETAGYYVTFSMTTISETLSHIEAMAYMFGYGDLAQKIIDDLRLQLYAIHMSAGEAVAKTGHKYTGMCTYAVKDNNWTSADNSGVGEMFRILHIENVYKLAASGNWDPENVIAAQPEFILFLMSDPREVDWDVAMRVPAKA